MNNPIFPVETEILEGQGINDQDRIPQMSSDKVRARLNAYASDHNIPTSCGTETDLPPADIEPRHTPKIAAKILSDLGIPSDEKSLGKLRFARRGPAFIKISGRIFYAKSDLLEYARGTTHHTLDSIAARSAVAPGDE